MSMRSPRCTTLRPTQLPTSLCTWTIGGSSEMRGFSWWKQSKTWILQVFRLYIVIYCDNVACNQSIQVHNLSLAISTALCRIWCMARETRGACLDRRPIGRCFIQNSETVIIYIYTYIYGGYGYITWVDFDCIWLNWGYWGYRKNCKKNLWKWMDRWIFAAGPPSNIQTNLLRIVKAKTALDSNLVPCHTGGTFYSWVGIE